MTPEAPANTDVITVAVEKDEMGKLAISTLAHKFPDGFKFVITRVRAFEEFKSIQIVELDVEVVAK
jgi:hypothetical protein